MYKEVSVDTYIETDNIKPKLEELSLFKPTNKREDENKYDDDNDENDEFVSLESQSLMKDIVEQLKDLGTYTTITYTVTVCVRECVCVCVRN